MEQTIAELTEKLQESERQRALLYKAVKQAIEHDHTTFAAREHRLALHEAMKQNGWEWPPWLKLVAYRP